jgi:hypothetical protein
MSALLASSTSRPSYPTRGSQVSTLTADPPPGTPVPPILPPQDGFMFLGLLAEWWLTAGYAYRQYATPIACLAVAGSFSAASMRWATSAREIV